jgi:putative transposase
MKKQTRGKKQLEELIPDEKKREEVLRRMYKGDPIVGEGGIFTDLLQALVNAAMEGEMDASIEASKKEDPTNRRNGHTRKTVRSNAGPLNIKTPRDRNGEYEPILIGKWDRELNSGLDEVILSLYARGLSVEDVRRQIYQIYGVEVSTGTISAVTDKVWKEIVEWQQRPLSSCYTIVYLDAIHFKVREDGKVISKAVYTVYGITVDGKREVMGLYISDAEGSRQWGLILEDIKRRGVEDILLFSVDGLKGFKEVIDQVYPISGVQRCIVHMVRSSTRFVSYKDIKAVCSDLRKVYTSSDRQQAGIALEAFGIKWNKKYPEIQPKWVENWEELMAFMDYNESIRRILYTTNPVEALHRVLRKVTKSKGAWSNEKGLFKQLYLTLMYNKESWTRNVSNWYKIQRDLIEYYGERYNKHL